MTHTVTGPHRIQRRRIKGSKMPENAVYVGRPTIWGNPFSRDKAIDSGYADETTADSFVVDCYRDWLLKGDLSDWWFGGPEAFDSWVALRRSLPTLWGKNLVCWCPIGKPCHADVLLEVANRI